MQGTHDNCTLKWLGIAGLELRAGGETLLFDPLFSRIRAGRTLLGGITPDEDAVRRHVSRCDGIFVTHAHYDHLLDAPLISAITGAALHGTKNACAIASACGVPQHRLRIFSSGSRVDTGSFSITALPGSHIRLPGFGYGSLPPKLAPPLPARRYRMDESLVFLAEAGGRRLLIGPGLSLSEPGPVDILLCCPIYLGRNLAEYVGRIHPRVFLPIHWEDMFRPAGLPPRPGTLPGFPLRRIDMNEVEKQVEALGVRYFQPERNREYGIDELME